MTDPNSRPADDSPSMDRLDLVLSAAAEGQSSPAAIITVLIEALAVATLTFGNGSDDTTDTVLIGLRAEIAARKAGMPSMAPQ